MAVNLSVFNFESRTVRYIIVENQPWFCLSDILLSIKSGTQPRHAIESVKDGLGDEFIYRLTEAETKKQLKLKWDELDFINEPAITFLVAQSRTDLAKQLNRKIHSEILPQIRKTGSYEPEQPKLNIYARRVQIASKWNIPEGHWCVFHEISLLANKVGEQFDVGEYDLIDGSVGIHWSKYRKNQLWALPTREFFLSFGDKRDLAYAKAHAYRDEELIYFRQWLRTDYESDKMVRYLRKKYTGLAVLY